VRRAVSAYLDELKNDLQGEIIPREHVVRGYQARCAEQGWPWLGADRLVGELTDLGCPAFDAVRVPWGRPLPTAGNPAPAAIPPPLPAPPVERPRPTARKASVPRDDALADLLSRLARGEMIPSQETLCDAWGRSKGTVSDWLSGWERARLIPQRRREGRCKIIHMPQRRAA
jgi:hypothetical protein